MATKTEIVNLALFKIGASKRLNNVDTERGTLAEAARAIYAVAIPAVLRTFPWPFATAYVALALVDGDADEPANYDWTFAYRYPTDCKYARRLVVPGGGGRNNPNPPPFRVGRDSQGRLIYTNEEDAQLEYTASIEDAGEFDDLMVDALSWYIAAGLAPTNSLIADMATKCMNMFFMTLDTAEARALNESQQEEPIESDFISSRDA